jgi:hypothetical protein
MVAHALEETRHAAVPNPLPLYKLATFLLDAILALTWRFVRPPDKMCADDPPTGVVPDRFVCRACGQFWSIPGSTGQSFVFRCACGARMIVYLERLFEESASRGSRNWSERRPIDCQLKS